MFVFYFYILQMGEIGERGVGGRVIFEGSKSIFTFAFEMIFE